jgi:hypothetical protein
MVDAAYLLIKEHPISFLFLAFLASVLILIAAKRSRP